MTPLEILEQELYDKNVSVVYNTLPNGLRGLYWLDKQTDLIILSADLATNAERLCLLAEEAGHLYTSYGNILAMSEIMSRKQERRARGWAYERLVPPEGIITAWHDYVRTPWELAEYFSVTHRFFADAMTYYHQKHAPAWHVDEYRIIFEPFSVAKYQLQG